jgi:hypothetical protein
MLSSLCHRVMITPRQRRSGIDGDCATSMAPLSMQLAEQGGEGHDKNLFTEIIADVQGPAAPIQQIGYLDQ